jgi:hypothetical protein
VVIGLGLACDEVLASCVCIANEYLYLSSGMYIGIKHGLVSILKLAYFLQNLFLFNPGTELPH